MFEPRQFGFLKDFLKREAGIVVDTTKEYLAVSRLAPIARDEGLADVNQLIEQLRRPNARLHRLVLDAMTVNETSFFRDPGVWRAMRDTVLPEMIEARAESRTLSIWSAASSSGQEPLSLAMTLLELLGPEAARWRIEIIATDLSTEMVQRTNDASYNQFEASRGLEPQLRAKYFEQQGDRWVAKPILKRVVTARVLNLNSAAWNLRGPFDMILIRNVLIYFDNDSRLTILRRCAPLLAKNAPLIVGASEGTAGIPEMFSQHRLPGLMTYRVGADAVPPVIGRPVAASPPSPPSRRFVPPERPPVTAPPTRAPRPVAATGSINAAVSKSPPPTKPVQPTSAQRSTRTTSGTS
ncbi:MAG: CheR family methyltransferase [Acidimicrobiales bacterium]